ncbi:hypothetical protein AAFF_G00229520 [Aldrovandia affinis]|uniref:Uncharacterized protein n=1 Tax=Aldrovandia affinis TaxID=143900 RepID=A0AAD7SXB1_9TELE|nr:hypothetical protein AAFF_G00229520 [Aldrovandia affinis]
MRHNQWIATWSENISSPWPKELKRVLNEENLIAWAAWPPRSERGAWLVFLKGLALQPFGAACTTILRAAVRANPSQGTPPAFRCIFTGAALAQRRSRGVPRILAAGRFSAVRCHRGAQIHRLLLLQGSSGECRLSGWPSRF